MDVKVPDSALMRGMIPVMEPYVDVPSPWNAAASSALAKPYAKSCASVAPKSMTVSSFSSFDTMVRMASFLPARRNMVVAPALPEPLIRGSGLPVRRLSKMAKDSEPSR